ncbi:deoxyribonuclease IV [Conexibacter sp. DBS9H8]|uniref:deoxyribonuclease IV n=1 Tax=Conexibacter sp. DBS9H8 TaxID=2937801 RepID=UPI0020106F76|nr:deoxyribonuclease IV [Conexibacter sp. DBS9H8]
MLIGAHVSTSGGLTKAVDRGVDLGADAIQIFNQSPRMWKPTAYREEDCAAFSAAMAGSRLGAVVIHAVYLINAASDDPEIRAKSLASLIQSLTVGAAIGAAGVILHAGSAKTGDVAAAIARAGEVIAEALAQSPDCPLHLENTAGAGGTLGRSFEELAALLEASGGSPRLGLCLDSCHLLASGYDIRTVDGLTDVLDRCAATVGLDRLGSLHLNDSTAPLGSNRDRHAAPGAGELGVDGLAVFLSEPRFSGLAVILETGSAEGAVAPADVDLARELQRRGATARRQ